MEEAAEREFAQKRVDVLFNMKGLLYSHVGRPEGSPPTVRNSNHWSMFQRLVSSRWTLMSVLLTSAILTSIPDL